VHACVFGISGTPSQRHAGRSHMLGGADLRRALPIMPACQRNGDMPLVGHRPVAQPLRPSPDRARSPALSRCAAAIAAHQCRSSLSEKRLHQFVVNWRSCHAGEPTSSKSPSPRCPSMCAVLTSINELSIGLAIVRAIGAVSMKEPMTRVELIAATPFGWAPPSLVASEAAGSSAEAAVSVEDGSLLGEEEASGGGASLKLKYSTMTNVARPTTKSVVETVLHVRSDSSPVGSGVGCSGAGSCSVGEAVWLSSFDASAAASLPTLRPTLPIFFHHMLDVSVSTAERAGRR